MVTRYFCFSLSVPASFSRNPVPLGTWRTDAVFALTLNSLGVCHALQVYWENGAQIISPHDKGISQAIEENLEPWPQAWDDSLIDSSPLLHNPTTSIHDTYFENLKQYCFHR